MKNIFVCLFLFVISAGIAQKSPPTPTLPVLQFSGVVLDQDSLSPIPFVAILVKGTKRGTVSDIYGFFTVVAYPGDVLEFRALTHKSRSFHISDSIRSPYHSIIQVLTKDTVDLPVVDVRPWPSKEDFKRAFLNLDLSDTDAERADKNISREELSYLERNASANGGENYMYVMQNYYTKIYAAGQSPQNRLLSPTAWFEFINAWKSGKLSNSNKKKTK